MEKEIIMAFIIGNFIHRSEPCIKIQNRILLKLKLPKVLNQLLDCTTCLSFWCGVLISLLTLNLLPLCVSIIVAIVFDKLI